MYSSIIRMSTRKELIIKKYAIFELELKQHIDGNLFPSLHEIDLGDFVYFVTLTFVGVDSEEQFQVKIKELAESNGVALSEEVFVKVVPLVMEFITWLKVL